MHSGPGSDTLRTAGKHWRACGEKADVATALPGSSLKGAWSGDTPVTANLRTKILDFGGLDSSIIVNSRGGILMSIGDFPESLSQAILAGIILV